MLEVIARYDRSGNFPAIDTIERSVDLALQGREGRRGLIDNGGVVTSYAKQPGRQGAAADCLLRRNG
jgi:hypothetical protein